MSREKVLEKLLRPITWDWSSSIGSRQNLVISRRKEVRNVLPFLNEEERSRAEEWLKNEKHEGLWD